MAAIPSLTTREYSSGSCMLRITGQISPLSQVASKPVMVRSRFHLQVLSEDGLEEPVPSSPASTPAAPRLEISGKADQFSALATTVSRYVQSQLALAESGAPIGARTATSSVALQPLGLTRHRLTLNLNGSANQGHGVELSALELADLADVLEQADHDFYLATEADLPKTRSSRPRLPVWIGSAAAVGIAAILGSQWLPPQMPLPSPSTVTRGGDAALDNNQEAETFSQNQTPQLETTAPTTPAAPEPARKLDTAPAAEGQLEPGGQMNSPADSASPGGTSSEGIPPMTGPGGRPSRVGAPAPQASTNGAPRTPAATSPPPPATEAAPSPAVSPEAAVQPSYPAASSDQQEALAESEAGPAAAPNPQSLRLPESTNPTGGAGTIGDQRSAPASVALPWQEQLRQQLQQGWTPIPNQTVPLSYRLTINRSGVLQSISPLSDQAQRYQERINWPEIGTSIPQSSEGTPIVVEFQFLPTGEVKLISISALPEDAAQE